MDVSFYLGPRQPRRCLDDWGQVVAAAGDGVLEEDQWVELKEALPVAGQGKSRNKCKKDVNLELAADLASLSADGGVFIVGIADDHGRAGEVTGTALEGVATRLSQVAVNSVHPPLMLTIDVVPKPGEPDVGVVVVSVPASAEAPHMAAGSYWGRSAEGKTPLSEAQVQRAYAQRAASSTNFIGRLHALAEREVREQPELAASPRWYLRIEPTTPAQRPLTEALRAADQYSLSTVIYRAQLEHGWASPQLVGDLAHSVPHPDGLAAASNKAQNAEEIGEHLFVLLRDDGGLDLCAPASRTSREGHDVIGWMVPASLIETVHNALALIARLAQEHTGYQGSWRVGVHGTHLRGRVAPNSNTLRGDPQPFASEDYQRTTTATTREIAENTSAVVARLVHDLLRGLSAERYLPYTNVSDLWNKYH